MLQYCNTLFFVIYCYNFVTIYLHNCNKSDTLLLHVINPLDKHLQMHYNKLKYEKGAKHGKNNKTDRS